MSIWINIWLQIFLFFFLLKQPYSVHTAYSTYDTLKIKTNTI